MKFYKLNIFMCGFFAGALIMGGIFLGLFTADKVGAIIAFVGSSSLTAVGVALVINEEYHGF